MRMIMYFKSFITLLIISCVDHYILFAYSQSNLSVVEFRDEAFTSNFSVDDEHQIQDVTENCTNALTVFSETISNLTSCTILNARPIRICTNCEEKFNATKGAYDILQSESCDCHKYFFESDEIGVINLIYQQGRDIWTKGNCQNCYDHAVYTEQFFKVSKDLDNCLKNFNKTSSKELNSTCNNCESLFIKLNKLYKNFVQGINRDESGSVCIDIVDQMNITRQIWKKMNCLRFDSDIGYPNIITAVVVGCIPVFFYMLAKSISSIEDIKLVRPKRKSFASLQSDSLQLPVESEEH